MTSYLLDTSVLSLLAPGREPPAAETVARLRAASDRLYIPSIAIAEIGEGIAKLERKGSIARARALDEWLAAVLERHASRALAFDTPCARIAGRIADEATATGRHPGFPDVAIAAIALSHGLAVVTGNARHFQPLGVAVCTLEAIV